MSKCFPNLTYEFEEIQPRLVFLLGKQVSDFVLTEIGLSEKSTNSDFQYQSYKFGNVEFIPIHHPSYILVYKRKFIEDYINGIGSHIQPLLNELDPVCKS